MEVLTENIQLFLPLIIIQVVLFIVAIIDIIRIKETNGPKWIWVIVAFLSILGPIIYFIFGRRRD
ncbi:PLDc N-terminal domain-containing protein [Ornithinibacillus halotolerans]|uniref:Negative regulatory protein YxlE n=1 Tax=Ornithinibacillus halotolerans TaxID=1274357 RepID=A0A916S8A9_9BACI|nr:PLDc N-terminal domain-containing protein [Ornithinibacillus halotolerans]GGA89221.1 negative regulatory protein YxlE [Ornithinibacillus halotolerans]